ncbi:MAG TPA: alanine--glyoxylate aminotransferase family protein [Oculatellaceae cyanobacterium]
MKQAELLMIPGPTPLPEAVREVLSRPALGHRSAGFKEVLRRVFPNLSWAFQSKNPVFLYTASGTGAMEAAVSNVCNPGDRVLVLVNGVFSGRWAEIATSHGVQVETLIVPPGEAHTSASLEEVLVANREKPFHAVFLNHSETSTGVLSPVRELAATIRRISPDTLVVVDAITSLGATEFDFDGWDLDIAVSGSQKGFMIPPGLSFLAYSDRAMEAHKRCKNPGYYFNFTRYLKSQQDETTPYTPGTHLILALDVALRLMMEEGLPQIAERHRLLQWMTRAGLRALGLSLFVPDDAIASPSVTSFLPPAGVTVDAVRSALRKRFGIVIADGQKDLKGKLMRIGHLGHVSERDVLVTLAALESVLLELGVSIQPGAAVAAAEQAKEERVASHV